LATSGCSTWPTWTGVSSGPGWTRAVPALRACGIVLQEKLDGCNVRTFFSERDQPVCQKRAGLLAAREEDQYNSLAVEGPSRIDLRVERR
jgi:hypothetical protein